MAQSQAVSLVENPASHALLLGIDKATGAQNAVSLIAYGPDPEDANATLIFVSPGYMQFQELKLGLPFGMFASVMKRSTHFSVMNISQQQVKIDPQSELGKIIVDFKSRIGAATAPDITDTIN